MTVGNERRTARGQFQMWNSCRLLLQVTPKCPPEIYEACQFDVLFENEETAYRDIIPALGHKDDFPK